MKRTISIFLLGLLLCCSIGSTWAQLLNVGPITTVPSKNFSTFELLLPYNIGVFLPQDFFQQSLEDQEEFIRPIEKELCYKFFQFSIGSGRIVKTQSEVHFLGHDVPAAVAEQLDYVFHEQLLESKVPGDIFAMQIPVSQILHGNKFTSLHDRSKLAAQMNNIQCTIEYELKPSLKDKLSHVAYEFGGVAVTSFAAHCLNMGRSALMSKFYPTDSSSFGYGYTVPMVTAATAGVILPQAFRLMAQELSSKGVTQAQEAIRKKVAEEMQFIHKYQEQRLLAKVDSSSIPACTKKALTFLESNARSSYERLIERIYQRSTPTFRPDEDIDGKFTYVSGVPGIGKTYTPTLLGKCLGVPVCTIKAEHLGLNPHSHSSMVAARMQEKMLECVRNWQNPLIIVDDLDHILNIDESGQLAQGVQTFLKGYFDGFSNNSTNLYRRATLMITGNTVGLIDHLDRMKNPKPVVKSEAAANGLYPGSKRLDNHFSMQESMPSPVYRSEVETKAVSSELEEGEFGQNRRGVIGANALSRRYNAINLRPQSEEERILLGESFKQRLQHLMLSHHAQTECSAAIERLVAGDIAIYRKKYKLIGISFLNEALKDFYFKLQNILADPRVKTTVQEKIQSYCQNTFFHKQDSYDALDVSKYEIEPEYLEAEVRALLLDLPAGPDANPLVSSVRDFVDQWLIKAKEQIQITRGEKSWTLAKTQLELQKIERIVKFVRTPPSWGRKDLFEKYLTHLTSALIPDAGITETFAGRSDHLHLINAKMQQAMRTHLNVIDHYGQRLSGSAIKSPLFVEVIPGLDEQGKLNFLLQSLASEGMPICHIDARSLRSNPDIDFSFQVFPSMAVSAPLPTAGEDEGSGEAEHKTSASVSSSDDDELASAGASLGAEKRPLYEMIEFSPSMRIAGKNLLDKSKYNITFEGMSEKEIENFARAYNPPVFYYDQSLGMFKSTNFMELESESGRLGPRSGLPKTAATAVAGYSDKMSPPAPLMLSRQTTTLDFSEMPPIPRPVLKRSTATSYLSITTKEDSYYILKKIPGPLDQESGAFASEGAHISKIHYVIKKVNSAKYIQNGLMNLLLNLCENKKAAASGHKSHLNAWGAIHIQFDPDDAEMNNSLVYFLSEMAHHGSIDLNNSLDPSLEISLPLQQSLVFVSGQKPHDTPLAHKLSIDESLVLPLVFPPYSPTERMKDRLQLVRELSAQYDIDLLALIPAEDLAFDEDGFADVGGTTENPMEAAFIRIWKEDNREIYTQKDDELALHKSLKTLRQKLERIILRQRVVPESDFFQSSSLDLMKRILERMAAESSEVSAAAGKITEDGKEEE